MKHPGFDFGNIVKMAHGWAVIKHLDLRDLSGGFIFFATLEEALGYLDKFYKLKKDY